MNTSAEFNFSFAPGITEEQIIGIELAGEMWGNYLGDTQQSINEQDIHNTVINIHVEVASDLLPENVIGGSFPAISNNYKQNIYDALTNDITTDNDVIATDSLINNNRSVLVNGELVQTEKMQLTTANLKALNLINSSSDGQELDGYILISDLSKFDSVEWNYDYLGGAKEGTLDFLSTVTHEIGHTLGFISGTDRVALTSETLDRYQNNTFVNIIEQGKLIKKEWRYTAKLDGTDDGSEVDPYYWGTYFRVKNDAYNDHQTFNQVKDRFDRAIGILDRDRSLDAKTAYNAFSSIGNYLKYNKKWEDFLREDELFIETKDNLDTTKLAQKMTSLDLFRYSNESSHFRANELTRGSSSYFSLDGSQTDLAMSNGRDYQGSHWQERENTQGLGVMNPTIAVNERWSISDRDLMAMDAIGWDVNYARSLDMQALYDKASIAADSARIENRQDDVDDILNGAAYDARRSSIRRAASIDSYSMLIDGYFSTFSQPVAALTESSNEVVAQIDDWLVVSNHHNRDAANNIVPVAPADSLVNVNVNRANVSQVGVDYLKIDKSSQQNDLLQKIKANLDHSLEMTMPLISHAIATPIL